MVWFEEEFVVCSLVIIIEWQLNVANIVCTTICSESSIQSDTSFALNRAPNLRIGICEYAFGDGN